MHISLLNPLLWVIPFGGRSRMKPKPPIPDEGGGENGHENGNGSGNGSGSEPTPTEITTTSGSFTLPALNGSTQFVPASYVGITVGMTLTIYGVTFEVTSVQDGTHVHITRRSAPPPTGTVPSGTPVMHTPPTPVAAPSPLSASAEQQHDTTHTTRAHHSRRHDHHTKGE